MPRIAERNKIIPELCHNSCCWIRTELVEATGDKTATCARPWASDFLAFLLGSWLNREFPEIHKHLEGVTVAFPFFAGAQESFKLSGSDSVLCQILFVKEFLWHPVDMNEQFESGQCAQKHTCWILAPK